jgi:hypothetical protein
MTATKTPRYYPAEDIKPAKATYRVKQNVRGEKKKVFQSCSLWGRDSEFSIVTS